MTSYQDDNDVRLQVKFLDSVVSSEQTHAIEREKNAMLRLAKSKKGTAVSLDDESEQLKQKAKDMQKAEADATRNAESNAAALRALKPSGALTLAANRKRALDQASRDSLQTHNSSVRRRGTHLFMRDLLTYLPVDEHLSRTTVGLRILMTGKRRRAGATGDGDEVKRMRLT